MSEITSVEQMQSECGVLPTIAKPTMNYRRTIRPGHGEIMERCWIVGDKLEWREAPVVDGRIVDVV